jgi:hypothetical protein
VDEFGGEIINPHGIPDYNHGRKRERATAKAGKSANGSSQAAPSATAEKKSDKFAGIARDTVHHAFNMDIVRKGFDWKMDPREALLRHAQPEGKPNEFVTGYEKTQPVKLLAEDPGEDGDQHVEITKKPKIG